MSPEVAKFLNNTLPTEIGVFTGSLPLMGVIAWFAMQQADRFKRVELAIDNLTAVVNTLVTKVAVMDTKIDSIENQPRIITS
jgi:hypothetical protein